MSKRLIAPAVAVVAMIGASPVVAQTMWTPGSEIVGQSVQVETNGVVNTVYFDAGGQARIVTPKGNAIPATWSTANQQLCLNTGAAQECWPYTQAFQAGQQVTLTSSCQSNSRWLANATNPPPAEAAPERG